MKTLRKEKQKHNTVALVKKDTLTRTGWDTHYITEFNGFYVDGSLCTTKEGGENFFTRYIKNKMKSTRRKTLKSIKI